MTHAMDEAQGAWRRADRAYRAALMDEGPDSDMTKRMRAILEEALGTYTSAKLDVREEAERRRRTKAPEAEAEPATV